MNRDYFNYALFFILVVILTLGVFFTKNSYNKQPTKDENLMSFLHGEKTISPIKKRYQQTINPELSGSLVVTANDKTLFGQNINTSQSMASITKLMTAIVILDNYKLSDNITIDSEVVKTDGDHQKLTEGDTYSVKNLLYIMLIESNNEAAEAFAKKIGRESFIKKMNEKARALKMNDTIYLNPTGLDITDIAETNKTSPSDIKKLVIHIIKNYHLIPSILSNIEYITTTERGLLRTSTNTNTLLAEDKDFLWGKTGFTDKAKGCLVIISRPPNFSFFEKNYIINIIMGAKDRFKEAKDFKAWASNQFIW